MRMPVCGFSRNCVWVNTVQCDYESRMTFYRHQHHLMIRRTSFLNWLNGEEFERHTHGHNTHLPIAKRGSTKCQEAKLYAHKLQNKSVIERMWCDRLIDILCYFYCFLLHSSQVKTHSGLTHTYDFFFTKKPWMKSPTNISVHLWNNKNNHTLNI